MAIGEVEDEAGLALLKDAAAEVDEALADAAAAKIVTLAAARNYSVDSEIDRLSEINVVPVDIQGVCSYTVYAGPELEYLVQFRLKSLALKTEISDLATAIYGSLVPKVITQLDFILAHGFPEDSPDNLLWRKTLMGDVAQFMALSWKAPQAASPEYRSRLRETYVTDLELLSTSLTSRFQPIIQTCIDAIDDILSLPMVLLYQDFGASNILVDEATCHLVGVIDWAEAEVCPFGLNLHSIRFLSGKIHLRNGWMRALDLLRSDGFTPCFANEQEPVSISDDEHGRYYMMSLYGSLINPETKVTTL
ncbi:hypothetical protein QBC32DRAFT_385963 [Pseudoneurospora amorphoporcata]|uniref:Aminoglycoside phosphotransferase domain-containing protein n=1 Tax=Pseudoneurospora amorphoporcata TaxID=241081 RepID=A0AAN6NJN8_9PEZI|nr:hypothetical protein QBC32DRAFT_385963 [Pseudoneurospora amorphoporcata]